MGNESTPQPLRGAAPRKRVKGGAVAPGVIVTDVGVVILRAEPEGWAAVVMELPERPRVNAALLAWPMVPDAPIDELTPRRGDCDFPSTPSRRLPRSTGWSSPADQSPIAFDRRSSPATISPCHVTSEIFATESE